MSTIDNLKQLIAALEAEAKFESEAVQRMHEEREAALLCIAELHSERTVSENAVRNALGVPLLTPWSVCAEKIDDLMKNNVNVETTQAYLKELHEVHAVLDAQALETTYEAAKRVVKERDQARARNRVCSCASCPVHSPKVVAYDEISISLNDLAFKSSTTPSSTAGGMIPQRAMRSTESSACPSAWHSFIPR